MNKKCILLVLGLLLIPGMASVVRRMEALAAKPHAKSGGPIKVAAAELISPMRLAASVVMRSVTFATPSTAPRSL